MDGERQALLIYLQLRLESEFDRSKVETITVDNAS